MRRSGKIEFLFWTFFLSVMLYIWVVAVGLQTFVLPDEPPVELPEKRVALMFVLYGFLIAATVIGSVVSIMIGNRRYSNMFGAMVIIVFGTVIAAKSIFG